MSFSAEEFRRRYAELSDEGLLAIHRDELTPVAQRAFDDELASRHLDEASAAEESADGAPAEDAEGHEPADQGLVEVAKCTTLEEAAFYRDLLRQAGIESVIPRRSQFSVNWAGVSSSVEVPLMVKPENLDEATEIIEAQISDEDLAAQAEAAAPKDVEPEEEDIDPE